MHTRRELLATALATAAGGLLGRSSPARAQQNPWQQLVEDYERVRAPAFHVPLPIPKTLQPLRRDGFDVYEMTARASTAQALAGAPTPVLSFDGQWPGPTLRATRGRPVLLRLRNELDESISLHNHGIKTTADSDGHPVDYVRPGTTKEYRYPNAQPAGTFWYHDHTHALTGPHVYRGLAGLYLIDDPEEATLKLPSGEHDVPLILQDRLFDASNKLSYTVDTGTIFKGFFGNTLCVNGVFTPYLKVSARKYRLRILNGSNARSYRLRFGNGLPFIQIASDGHMLPLPLARESIDLWPAERADCVVDFSALAVGTSVVLHNVEQSWPLVKEVMRFDVVKKESDDSRIPKRLPASPRLAESTATVHRTVRMDIIDGKWALNGLLYDPARIDFRPRLDTTEIWTLYNAESTQTHPIHQHLVPFNVLDIDGKPPPPWLAGYKDTVAVRPGSTVRIIMRFDAFPGVYVFHCHNLEHEDHAMMLQQEVIG